jgi:hypothetical protein
MKLSHAYINNNPQIIKEVRKLVIELFPSIYQTISNNKYMLNLVISTSVFLNTLKKYILQFLSSISYQIYLRSCCHVGHFQ